MAQSLDFQTVGLSSETRLIPLRGFSGCCVTLVDDKRDLYVRKLARDKEYSARLLRQAEKQQSFRGNDHFQPVKIRAIGHLPSGIAYIDMDYVPGVTAAEALMVLPLADIQSWVATLLHLAEVPQQGTLAPTILLSKIEDLRGDLSKRHSLTKCVAEVLNRLSRRPWTNIPLSLCHGDLTLENIIVHEGKLYLIDFLDSFADSWYIDIAKLFQDLLGGWSFRRSEVDRNLVLRLASLRHSLEAALEARCPGSMAVIRDLYALNLLRILPYSSLVEEKNFIENLLIAALDTFL